MSFFRYFFTVKNVVIMVTATLTATLLIDVIKGDPILKDEREFVADFFDGEEVTDGSFDYKKGETSVENFIIQSKYFDLIQDWGYDTYGIFVGKENLTIYYYSDYDSYLTSTSNEKPLDSSSFYSTIESEEFLEYISITLPLMVLYALPDVDFVSSGLYTSESNYIASDFSRDDLDTSFDITFDKKPTVFLDELETEIKRILKSKNISYSSFVDLYVFDAASEIRSNYNYDRIDYDLLLSGKPLMEGAQQYGYGKITSISYPDDSVEVVIGMGLENHYDFVKLYFPLDSYDDNFTIGDFVKFFGYYTGFMDLVSYSTEVQPNYVNLNGFKLIDASDEKDTFEPHPYSEESAEPILIEDALKLQERTEKLYSFEGIVTDISSSHDIGASTDVFVLIKSGSDYFVATSPYGVLPYQVSVGDSVEVKGSFFYLGNGYVPNDYEKETPVFDAYSIDVK